MQSRKLPDAVTYQPEAFRAHNAKLRALTSQGRFDVPLDVDSILAQARAETGLHEPGDGAWRESMAVLLASYEDEADLNPSGRERVRADLVKRLKHRLWAQDLFTSHPEILERQITAPVVVMGLGRSGTTRLHRMLASDPRLTSLQTWELQFPVPWPECFGKSPDPRFAACEAWLEQYHARFPGRGRFHPFQVTGVDEEALLLQQTFSSICPQGAAMVPAYTSWLLENDQTGQYGYMRNLMQLAAWYRGDPDDATWVLKAPQHMLHFPSLLAVFPDARLVWAHRDPLQVLRSVCAYVWNAVVQLSDSVQPHDVGPEWARITLESLHRAERDRPMVPDDRQIDVLFADVQTDWRAQFSRIYELIDLPFDEQTERAMTGWLATNRQEPGAAYNTDLEDFGIDPDQMADEIAFVRAAHGIPVEGKRTR
jgi:hypothetical protein